MLFIFETTSKSLMLALMYMSLCIYDNLNLNVVVQIILSRILYLHQLQR